MSSYICRPLYSRPGIQRDGTPYNSQSYIDGQWVRFYQGLPRKIGGYQAMSFGTNDIIRSIYAAPSGSKVNVFLGYANAPSCILSVPFIQSIDPLTTSFLPITPIDYFTNNDNNLWKFDLYTNTNSDHPNPSIIAFVAPLLNDINFSYQTTDTPNCHLYYTDSTNPSTLEIITDGKEEDAEPIIATGGIVFVSPILIAYGDNGAIKWNNPLEQTNDPLFTWSYNDVPFTTTIANTKIVYGTPIIGAQVPTALFWSLNSLVSVSFTPAQLSESSEKLYYQPSINPIESNISIISGQCVVRYGQTFFWIGVDQFYMYNGVVQTLPNEMNRQWFFDNVNLQWRNKIFGMSIPTYDEIWWFFPFGNATECNTAIIYNVKEQVWYDSNCSRAAGLQAGIFPNPILSDSHVVSGIFPSNYLLWVHETGTDQVFFPNGGQGLLPAKLPINSFFSHAFMETCSSGNPDQNRFLRNRRLELDFVMPENTSMTMQILNLIFPNDYTNGNGKIDGPYVFDSTTPYIEMSSQGRFVSIAFQSNALGGNYQMGKILYECEPGDISTAIRAK